MLECESIESALSATMEWQGAYFYFESPLVEVRGSMALMFWNDEAAEQTTFALFESSTLFNQQRESAQAWSTFQKILVETADLLDAPFCWMECDPPLRTPDEEAIGGMIDLIQRGRYVPLFLALHLQRFPQAAKLYRADARGYSLREELGYLLVSEKDMGMAEED